MPTIDPSLVPTISPGTLFSRLTTDSSLTIRFLTAADPNYFGVLNRPHGDIALRQLIIAKTLDAVNLRLGHQALFPFLIQPLFRSGTSNFEIPASFIWDMHPSIPRKWEKVRLAKIKRVSGTNFLGTTGTADDNFTGKLRLVFTAQEQGSTTEVSIFQADYTIDSALTFQPVRVTIPTANEETVPLDEGERDTIDGFVTFRTLDVTDTNMQDFLLALEPPVGGTVGSDGEYLSPTVYEIVDTPAGGVSVNDDFDLSALSHGTGTLTLSAWNSIPPINSDVDTWINTFNYPFRLDATRASSSPGGITIPIGLFNEFSLSVPAGDQPEGDTTGAFSPVWINRIRRDDTSADTLSLFFATFNVTDSPSTVPVEFARLTLSRDYLPGRVVQIESISNLFNVVGSESDDWNQELGRGHVVLSSKWGATTTEVDDFFDAFLTIIDSPPDVVFVQESTVLSSFGLSRVPRFSPTAGQAAALMGSKSGISAPDMSNRYVVEDDQGLGEQVDFSVAEDLPVDKRENPDIERFGWSGSLAHRSVKLVVNTSGEDHDYDNDILPRLKILLGRSPIYGDEWFDGTRFKKFNGDTWIG